MSLIGQLHSKYGQDDVVGLYRDIDLVLALLRDHPSIAGFHDRILDILSQNGSDKAVSLRNDMFQAYGYMGTSSMQTLSEEDKKNISGIDKINSTYKHLLAFRHFMLTNPETGLKWLIENIGAILHEYPLDSEAIVSIEDFIKKASSENFQDSIENMSHVQKVAFLEGCITEGKCLDEIISFAKNERKKRKEDRQNSFEYWDYNNIVSLAQTRERKMREKVEGSKAFSLSGGSGNAFIEPSIMVEHIKHGGKISSISATSAGSAMAVLIGVIGHDPEKLDSLMNDFRIENLTGDMPRKLHGHERQMKESFDKIAIKYGLTYDMKFSDLRIPVLVNAGRQYEGGEQEIVLGGDENIMDAIWASQNVPSHLPPWRHDNIGMMGISKVHDVAMIDYAANERGNPTHWLELIGEIQEDIVVVDVGYSSEKGGSSIVRRLYKRPTIRDMFAKMRAIQGKGVVINPPIESSKGYTFPIGKFTFYEELGKAMYRQHFTSQSSPQISPP